MRITKACTLIFAVAMVALFTMLPGQAAEKTAFTGTGTAETVLSPGTRICPGFPDQPDYLPCPGRTVIRGYVMARPVTMSDPRLSGVTTCEMDWNIDANYEGQYSGRCVVILDGGGVEEDTFTGRMAWTGTPWASPFFGIDKDVAHITGGPFDGCIVKFEAITDMFTGQITFSGYILDPHDEE
jgi:hypothetical protein